MKRGSNKSTAATGGRQPPLNGPTGLLFTRRLDVQQRFIQFPAAFITLPAAFIPFSFSVMGGRLSCAASERRLSALFVATKQRGTGALADTLPSITQFEGYKNEDVEGNGCDSAREAARD